MKTIIVKSAISLTEEQKRKLEQGISAKESQSLNFVYQVDCSVISGIVLLDGERVLDAGGANKLEKIAKLAGEITKNAEKGVTAGDVPALIAEKAKSILKEAPQAGVCGRVISSADGVVKISGLKDARYGELLVIGKSGFALAMNLESEVVGAILLSDASTVEYGDLAFTTGTIIEVPVGDALLGRVIDPLGNPLDGKGRIKAYATGRIESDAPGIVERAPVSVPLHTGILAIDSMVPIGRGQRELIIGDRQTGKTAIALDTIINQRGKNVKCVYVAIGQRAGAVARLVRTLQENDALSYTTVVVSTASDSAPLQYIAPYAGCAIAEHFMKNGEDVLVVYDDLSKHAVAYRTISLLLRRPAGREAYPGDIFYLHSKLLERSAKLGKEFGGGSITALPIIETQAGDISAYIPTNVISITDGQIYLESDLFNAGQRPAINVGLSVSRVGGSAQTAMTRKLASKLRLSIAHYRELAIFSQFGSSLDDETKNVLDEGRKTEEALKQAECSPLDIVKEEIFLFAIVNGYLKSVPLKKVKAYLEEYFAFVLDNANDILDALRKNGNISAEEGAKLGSLTDEFTSAFADRC